VVLRVLFNRTECTSYNYLDLLPKMVSKRQTAKYDELSEGDHKDIATIILGWVFFQNMLMKLTPEDYAERVFLKIGKSKNKPAIIRLLFDIVREKSNSVKSPDEFNQTLAREMLDQSMESLINDTRFEQGNQKHSQHYLDSRRMSEVLRFLRDRRVLRHIEGKQDIRKEMHWLPGRIGSHSLDTFNERFRGKPSADLKTDNLERILRLLQKPRARSIVYEALKETNILYEFERFMLSAFYIALKKRKLEESKNILLVQYVMNATSSYPIGEWEIRLVYEQTYEQ
jgi:hypothetical protein